MPPGRRRLLIGVAAAVLLVLAAIPLTAYVIIPRLVSSTVNEAAPGATPTPAAGGTGSPAVGATPASGPRTVATGELRQVNAVDFGHGRVLVIQDGDRRFLRFDNVEIAGAPAQRVYLSDADDGRPGNFTDLGDLRATNGSFNYEIPAAVDLSRVRSVVSWCRQFNTTVTYAVLQPA
ncbi:MAG: hypothetical protein QOE92_1976 [Chloroflexota bacterium]|nr:hypothetical protein [Chloroflexota bacterium]